MLPAVARSALLLDIDGTLIDLAATPDAVVVPPDLVETLMRLRAVLGDALGVITGRPLAQVDALLPGVPFAAAGEHGGAIRRAPGGAVERAHLADVPEPWFDAAAGFVAGYPGALMERKQRGFVLHYRQAPAAGTALYDAALSLVATDPERFQLLQASMAWEVRPAGIDKGIALERICAEAPFAGRLPIFIGDDVTDEDGIRVAIAMGGTGLLVDPVFGSPAGVRDWLRRSAAALEDGGEWPSVTER